jgi:hypothetical protein
MKIHLHNFSKMKSPKEVTKQQEPRFFLLFLLDEKDPDLYLWVVEAQRHVNTVDPDPDSEHWLSLLITLSPQLRMSQY